MSKRTPRSAEISLGFSWVSFEIEKVGIHGYREGANFPFGLGDPGANLRFEKIRERDRNQDQDDRDDDQELD
jgi:hypothetical protein